MHTYIHEVCNTRVIYANRVSTVSRADLSRLYYNVRLKRDSEDTERGG